MEKLELFLKWLENFDISYDGIELRKCDFGYGIFAKRDFHINETILSIPLQLLITPSSVVQLSKYQQILVNKNIKLKPFEILVLFFILEEIESSLWSPYLQILPITFTTLAAAGAELDISYLPLNARTLWEKQSNEMKMMFNKFHSFFSTIYADVDGRVDFQKSFHPNSHPKYKLSLICDSMTWERFFWAWHIVNTRSIFSAFDKPHASIDGEEGNSLAVIPFVDMFNHSNDCNAYACWDSIAQRYKIISCKLIANKKQIFLCYGAHSNDVLWMEYGFTLPNNICNKVNISHDLFIALAKEVGVEVSDLHIRTIKNANIPCTLYASDISPNFGFKSNIRILKLSINELKSWSRYVYDEAEEVNNVESEISMKILKRLREHFKKKADCVPPKFQSLWIDQISIIEIFL